MTCSPPANDWTLAILNSVDQAFRPDRRPAFPLSVARLTLTNFRCHEALRLDTPAVSVVLTGSNGAGKTSVLEALSLLAPGRGLRRARSAELLQREADGIAGGAAWAVNARVRSLCGHSELAIGWQADTDGVKERRQIRINGQTSRGQGALADIVGLVWLTPEMDRLFTDGASARRRFLDRLVVGLDSGHAARTAAYERALQQRSLLLRQGSADPAWLTALEDTLASHGVAIAAARRDVVERLTETCVHRRGPFPAATLTTSGPVERWLESVPALAAEDRMRAELAAGRRADAETGGASIGPHRSDLVVRHGSSGRPAGDCSTGEQKTLLIAIILAGAALQAIDRGVVPVLLMDEVAAHLDDGHRAGLFEAIADLGAQAWYAGTDPTVFAPLAGGAYFVTVGKPGDRAATIVAAEYAEVQKGVAGSR